MTRAQHIVNVSGGKDSACCYLLAMERGMPFIPVFADTGHEHSVTYEWVQSLAGRTGGPEVRTVRADFTHLFKRRREFISTKWREQGVREELVVSALEVMRPTGNPFLDICILKGRFPSTRRRFCTTELKVIPIREQLMDPIRETRPVIRWQGERWEESPARRNLPRFHKIRDIDGELHPEVIYRPILEWKWQDVFAFHRRHGLEPNPLYKEGMTRVGCFPCINCNKTELRAISNRFPEAFEKLERWESIVSRASKRGRATFWSANIMPKHLYEDPIAPFPEDVRKWSLTRHGGRTKDLLAELDAHSECSSEYGLCE